MSDTPENISKLIRSRFVNGSLWTFFLNTLNVPLNVIANIFVARELGVENYAVFASIIASYGIISSITNFGLSETTVVMGTRAWTQQNTGRLDELLAVSRTIHLAILFPLLTFATFSVIFQGFSILFGLFTFINLISFLFSSEALRLSCEARTRKIAQIAFASNFAAQAALIFSCILFSNPLTLFAIKSIVSSHVSIFIVLIVVGRKNFLFSSKINIFWLDRELRQFVFRACFLTYLNILVTGRFTIIVIERFGNGADAGIYALSFGIAVQVTVLTDWIYANLLALCADIQNKNSDEFSIFFRRLIRIFVWSSTIAFSTISLILYFLIPILYGSEFEKSRFVIPAIFVFILLSSVSRLFEISTYSQGKNRDVFFIMILRSSLALILSFFFIPSYGISGAIFTLFASGLAGLIYWILNAPRIIGCSRLNLLFDLTPLGFMVSLGSVIYISLPMSEVNAALWLCLGLIGVYSLIVRNSSLKDDFTYLFLRIRPFLSRN